MKKILPQKILLLITFAILLLPSIPYSQTLHGKVISVADGDTITILSNQKKQTIKEILKSGWEDGAPILSERRKELERILKELDVFVGDDVIPDENNHIH